MTELPVIGALCQKQSTHFNCRVIIMKWKEWSEFARNEAFWRNHEERGLLKAE
ncbi:MAG: hypothetical protein ONB05_02010 [candidate division KSB1 bacterium]|nr:hypothetical protein [candidate division KSB1 bacterium]